MKAIVCDHCQKQERAEDLYGNPPKPWVTLTHAGASRDSHYCGTQCAIKALSLIEERPATTTAAGPAAVQ